MFEQERRKAERLPLTPPITGELEQRPVKLVDIGALGTTIEHEEAIVGGPIKLRFRWDGEEIAVDCAIVHSKKTANIFSTGLSFVGTEPPALRPNSAW